MSPRLMWSSVASTNWLAVLPLSDDTASQHESVSTDLPHHGHELALKPVFPLKKGLPNQSSTSKLRTNRHCLKNDRKPDSLRWRLLVSGYALFSDNPWQKLSLSCNLQAYHLRLQKQVLSGRQNIFSLGNKAFSTVRAMWKITKHVTKS